MDDRELIAMLNARDESAVHALFETYGGLCRSIISHIVRDRRDAEECMNSVAMSIWRSIPPARPRDLKAYVAKAARNEALMVIRRNRAKRNAGVTVPLDELEACLPAPSGPEAEAETKELTRAINRFLKTLSAEKRGVFLRRYWFFDSVKEIAARYGISESKTASMLSRMRAALRGYLEKEELL